MNKTERHIIWVPAGQNFIEAAWLANQIAECLVPVPDTPPLLVSIKKKTPEDKPDHYRIDDLTDEDVDYLRGIWPGLNIPSFWSMTQEQWKPCREAFDKAPDRPAWDLVPMFDDFRAKAKGERGQAAFKHFRQLEAEAKAGKLRLLDSHRAPASTLEPGTLISIDDARAYLVPLSFELAQSPGETGRQCASTPPAKDAGTIPGRVPRVASGRLAVKAAWEIECETGKRASTKDVMKRMQQWAEEGEHGELTKKLPGNAVEWMTTKNNPKSFDLEACGKALEAWQKSRG